MIDQNIKRFCELVAEINLANEALVKASANFYHGGYSFEECNSYTIEELTSLQNEFKELLILITEKQ